MNLFFLSMCLETLAALHCDKHVVKMPLEIAQMLYTALWCLEPNIENVLKNAPLTTANKRGYRQTHKNHPTSVWIRSTKGNYVFAVKAGLEICKEYTRRYHKIHKVEEHLNFLLKSVPKSLKGNMTIPPQAMPECYRTQNPKSFDDVVRAYTRYYIFDKMRFAKWGGDNTHSKHFSMNTLSVKELRAISNKKGLTNGSKYIKKDELIKILS